MVTAIAVPLDGEKDQAVGAIALYHSRNEWGFSEDHRSLLRLISANASTAVRLLRSRLERERIERLSTIGRLLSGVMHDMRTPLTVISGYVQLMATAADASQRAEHAHLILNQFDLIRAMQREVLDFARGERTILLRKVYLSAFFNDIEKQLRHELADTGVELSVVVHDRSTARFDEAKMTRAIHNLVRNAIEAIGPGGGKIIIDVRRDEDSLVVAVSDTGKGIPPEIKDKLFQSFVTAGKRGGTGLGLPIVKKIVDEHQGSVTVSSSSGGGDVHPSAARRRAPPHADRRASGPTTRLDDGAVGPPQLRRIRGIGPRATERRARVTVALVPRVRAIQAGSQLELLPFLSCPSSHRRGTPAR